MYDDVFTLQQVAPLDVETFNQAAGMIPVLRDMVVDVSIQF